MYLNEFADDLAPRDMRASAEFASLLESAADLGHPARRRRCATSPARPSCAACASTSPSGATRRARRSCCSTAATSRRTRGTS